MIIRFGFKIKHIFILCTPLLSSIIWKILDWSAIMLSIYLCTWFFKNYMTSCKVLCNQVSQWMQSSRITIHMYKSYDIIYFNWILSCCLFNTRAPLLVTELNTHIIVEFFHTNSQSFFKLETSIQLCWSTDCLFLYQKQPKLKWVGYNSSERIMQIWIYIWSIQNSWLDVPCVGWWVRRVRYRSGITKTIH